MENGAVAAADVEDSRVFMRRKVLTNQPLEVRRPGVQSVRLRGRACSPGRGIMLIEPLAIWFHSNLKLCGSCVYCS